MSVRIGLVADRSHADLAAARTWFGERGVQTVLCVDGQRPHAGFRPLELPGDGSGEDPSVTLLVAGPRPPEHPLVGHPVLAARAPAVVVGGYVQGRPSRAAGPVLELGQGTTGTAGRWCAMVEISRLDQGALWVWQETGRLGGHDGSGDVLSATVEAWMHDGVHWQLRSTPRRGGGHG